MRIRIVAIGRLRAGPEASLIDDYLTRYERTGRSLGLGMVQVEEFEARKGGQAEEAALLLKSLERSDFVVALDERGKTMTSPQFADRIVDVRDAGLRDMAFVVGGADGLTPNVRDRADLIMSFGKMVWPHMLARVMLTEQLYRAASILAGAPYHRA